MYSILFRQSVIVSDGFFAAVHSAPTSWTHIVMNYVGPNDGEGVRMFLNGMEVTSDTTKTSASLHASGDGRITLGRDLRGDGYYLSVQFDELLFFNAELTPSQIQSIYNGI